MDPEPSLPKRAPTPSKNILLSDQRRENGQRALGAITPSFVHYTHEIVFHLLPFCEGPFKNILRPFFSLSPSRAAALGSLGEIHAPPSTPGGPKAPPLPLEKDP